jgi:hypothetical protein
MGEIPLPLALLALAVCAPTGYLVAKFAWNHCQSGWAFVPTYLAGCGLITAGFISVMIAL